MYHAMLCVTEIFTAGGPDTFNATTLINRNVDDHAALLHLLYHGLFQYYRGASAGKQYRTDDDIRFDA
jgi:hypothetical protein